MRPLHALLFVWIAAVPGAGWATPVWATWAASSSSAATGTLAGGGSAAFTGTVAGINTATTNGGFYTASPVIPGLAAGENPSSVGALTTPNTNLNAGELIFSVDLTAFVVDSNTVFGIRDMFQPTQYRIELLDGSSNPLSLASVQIANFNLTYVNGIVADYDITLDTATGSLRVNPVHDSNTATNYQHTGLALFSNLPAGTRFIRLLSDASFLQRAEGIGFYLAGTPVPEPTLGMLLAAVCATRAIFRRR